jgi:hypothetical protein
VNNPVDLFFSNLSSQLIRLSDLPCFRQLWNYPDGYVAPTSLRGSVLPVRDWLRVAGRTQGCSFVYWVERVCRGTYERCCKNLVFLIYTLVKHKKTKNLTVEAFSRSPLL